ncbi:MBL fold metallo-hydrolase [Desulforudis sp. DRI-14]|uniref:MBL fold metallo-hydrolase n=1 Tax=Desulforudis sp. DRI-14 TaxID=3459793 RepID=UPI0040423BD1
MQFAMLTVGMLDANCYIVGCPESRDAAVVDPGGDVDRILGAARDKALKIKWIVLTHVHYDHIAGLPELQERTGAKLAVHRDDNGALADPGRNLAQFFGGPARFPAGDLLLLDGDEIPLGKIKLRVIHTPGHTPGGICVLDGNDLYTGDTLFAGAVGRPDLPGGDFPTLIRSIKEKLLALDDGVLVYPGHGEASSVGRERRSNPYLTTEG